MGKASTTTVNMVREARDCLESISDGRKYGYVVARLIQWTSQIQPHARYAILGPFSDQSVLAVLKIVRSLDKEVCKP